MRLSTGLNRSLYGATTMRGSGSAIGVVGGAMSIVDKNLIEKARELGEKFRLYRNIKANMRGGMYGYGKKEEEAKAERQAIIDKEDEEEERAFMALLDREEKIKIRENKIKKELADIAKESDDDYLIRLNKERVYRMREKKEKQKNKKVPMKAIEKKAPEKAPMKVEKKAEKKAEKKTEKKAEKKVEKLENKIEELKEVIVELKEDKKEMTGSPSKKIKCRICGVIFDNYHLMSPVHLEALAKRKAERIRLKEEDKKNNPEKYERLARERKQRANAWITHLKVYREANPDVSYKVAMQRAKETYNR